MITCYYGFWTDLHVQQDPVFSLNGNWDEASEQAQIIKPSI